MNKMGFGFQRIPTLSSGDVDFDKLIPIVDRYMELGGTFYDTAYMYLDGKSEEALKKCVVERYPRDAYQIQDKFPLYTIKDPSEFDSYLQLLLGRCGLDYFDSFLLHWMNDEIYQKALDMDAFEYMRKLKRDGVTRKIGFSFHGGSALLERILTEQPGMDVVVLQINYVDWKSPSIEGQRCYQLAVEHGLDIVVMEPLKGGALANLPEAAMAKLAEYEAVADATTVGPEAAMAKLTEYEAANFGISVASPIGDSSSVDATSTDRAQLGGASPIGDKPSAPRWGLRFVQSLPGVTICLSGMNDMAQIEENMADVTPMSDGERDVLREVVSIINSDITVACTSCNYCRGHCPVHIPIAGYFNLYNEYMRLPDERWKMGHAFAQLTAGEIDDHVIGRASDCIRCGICVRHCPQGLDIPKYMAEIAETV